MGKEGGKKEETRVRKSWDDQRAIPPEAMASNKTRDTSK